MQIIRNETAVTNVLFTNIVSRGFEEFEIAINFSGQPNTLATLLIDVGWNELPTSYPVGAQEMCGLIRPSQGRRYDCNNATENTGQQDEGDDRARQLAKRNSKLLR